MKNGKRAASGLLRGSAIIAAGGLISKVLGAVYRIPLTNLLKGEGLGIYQTAFPLYCLLLTFSSTGAPSAIAKLVSSENSGGADVLKRALSVFTPIGVLGTILMALLSPLISALQGNPDAYFVYITLAPSVALVSVISCFRGYFQGKKNMAPTAISQVIEQAVKLAVGLFLCASFGNTPVKAAAFATLAVSVSEAAALLYLLLLRKKVEDDIPRKKFSAKKLIATVIPITFSTLLLPIARVYDSFTVVNFLKEYTDKATSLYGVYTGGAETVIGLPVSVCYGVAVASLPAVASLIGNKEFDKAHEKAGFSLICTFFLSSAAAVFVLRFPRFIVGAIYGGLTLEEQALTVSLLKASAINIILLSLVQTETSCLIAFGKNYAPCVFLVAGLLVKAVLQPFLLKIPSVNIFAPLISDILCYFVAVLGNLVYIIIYRNKGWIKTADENNSCGNRNKVGRYISRRARRSEKRQKSLFAHRSFGKR
ncbi:MAG: polysaccharide biosynthesis protein [Clostridia bacterium]|nr:polysaccharide biosynthesis protein [Clostridia bacterium]